jgi:hypothetical protein
VKSSSCLRIPDKLISCRGRDAPSLSFISIVLGYSDLRLVGHMTCSCRPGSHHLVEQLALISAFVKVRLAYDTVLLSVLLYCIPCDAAGLRVAGIWC